MEEIRAVVRKVVTKGKHGPFVVATSEETEGSITFSLDSNVWQEDDFPEGGMEVVLSDVRRKRLREKRSGWRAMRARFLRPSDEKETKKGE